METMTPANTSIAAAAHERLTRVQSTRGAACPGRAAPTELVLAHGDTLADLLRLRDHDGTVAELARMTQARFDPTARLRLALVVASGAELRAKLGYAATLLKEESTISNGVAGGVYVGEGPATPGRTALVFPGQGAQYVGMSAGLTVHFPQAGAVWAIASRVLPGLSDVVFPPLARHDEMQDVRERKLSATQWAQPALAVHSLVLLNLLRALGLRPAALAGYSFGELVALHAAGGYDAPALLRLARRRGELMRDATRMGGAMLAAFGDAKEVAAALLAGEVAGVSVANHNGPAGVVLSGTVAAIMACGRVLSDRGIPVRRLDTGVAFHSRLVAPAIGPLRAFLGRIPVHPTILPAYSTRSAQPYPDEPHEIRRLIIDQMTCPVRFADTIEAMYTAGVRTFVEVGAGSTLTTMISRILAGRRHVAVNTDRRGVPGVTCLHLALGQLAARGVRLDFTPLWLSTADAAGPVP